MEAVEIKQEDCWLKDCCSKIDCNTFCLKYYKLNYLYESALVPLNKRKHIDLFVDADGSDTQSFGILKQIENSIDEFVDQGHNLYIYSRICGNGKSAWSLRLLQAYFNKIWLKSELKCRALFINVPRFLLALKDNISQKSDYAEHIKQNVIDCDLVIWDEVGTKGLTQFEHENILNYINARVEAGKANIYTSNLSLNELHDAVGDRLYSRIVNLSSTIEFFGGDKRGLALE